MRCRLSLGEGGGEKGKRTRMGEHALIAEHLVNKILIGGHEEREKARARELGGLLQ